MNCSNIPETLLESVLFGYSENSFTGAKPGGEKGLFETADGGTVFLDEIGDLSLALQGKLLRVLQEKEITRVGAVDAIPVNVRIIAATNVDLEKKIATHLFRDDLYYRINIFPILIPSLRIRKEDIYILAQHFLLNSAHAIFGRFAFELGGRQFVAESFTVDSLVDEIGESRNENCIALRNAWLWI